MEESYTSKHSKAAGKCAGIVHHVYAGERSAGLQMLRVLQVQAAACESAGIAASRDIARSDEGIDTYAVHGQNITWGSMKC